MNQKLNMIDKVNLSLVKHELDLKAALEELNNENLTECESRQLHVEIEKLTFSINVLKFIEND
tara:strand:+ start:271 stop:459 length:189 start_codon:yes stop_codon:yes gene_type:complete